MKSLLLAIAALFLMSGTPTAQTDAPLTEREVITHAAEVTPQIDALCTKPDDSKYDSGGTGFYVAVTEDSVVVATAKHVVDSGNDKCIFSIAGQDWIVSRIVEHPMQDVALIHFKAPNHKVRPVELSEDVWLGQPLFIVGYPQHVENDHLDDSTQLQVSRGYVITRYKNAYNSGEDLWRTDADIWFGNSGGPVYDMNGRVIGTVVALGGPVWVQPHYLFVPVEYTKELL